MLRRTTAHFLPVFLTLACATDSTGPREPVLVFSKEEHDFGDVPLGMSSDSLRLVLVNRGSVRSGEVTITLAGQHGSDFTITRDLCTGTRLRSGGTCIVEVRLHPTSPGGKHAVVRADIPPGQTVTSTVSGNGSDSGLRFSGDSVIFGDNVTGTTRVLSVSLRNSALVTTGPLETELSGTGASAFTVTRDGCRGQSLPFAVSCDFEIRYAAGSPGESEATLTVRGSPGGVASARIRGVSGAPTILSVSTAAEDFGLQRLRVLSVARKFTVTNQGAAPSGAMQAVLGGTNVNDFVTAENGCSGNVLAPGASCNVWVRFRPITTGPRSATLTASAAFGSTASSALSGFGGSIVFQVHQSRLDLGSQQVGGSVEASFEIWNVGTMTSGTVTGVLPCAGVAGCESPFSFVNSCGPIEAGASCILIVRFSPTAVGMREDRFIVGDGPTALSMFFVGRGS